MKGNTLLKNTVLLSIGTLFAKGMQFLLVLLVSYWLTTEQYGLFDVLNTYITLLLPLLSLATGEAVFRFCASAESIEEKAKYITNGLCITSGLLVLCLLVLFGLQKAGVTGLRMPFALLLVSQLYNYYFQEYVRAIKQLKVYTWNLIISTCMIIFFSIALVYGMGLGLQGLLLAHFLGYLAGDFFVVFYTKIWLYLDRKAINGRIAKEIVKYSLPLVPNNISWWILSVSDRQIIHHFMGAAANGIYAIANKIPALYSSVYTTFNVSWQQEVVEKMEDPDRGVYFNEIYNRVMVFLFTLCSGILSVVFLLFSFIFDSRYHEGYLYVPILLSAAIFASQMQFCGGIQIGLKKTYENGMTTIAGAVINLAVNITMIRYWGLSAASFSTLIANLSVAWLRKMRLRKVVQFKYEKKTWFAAAFYLYFVFTVYICQGNMLFKWLHVAVAAIMFLIFQKEFLIRMMAHRGRSERGRKCR